MRLWISIAVLLLLVVSLRGEEAIVFSVIIGEEENGVITKINPDGSGATNIFTFEGVPASEDGYIKNLEISPSGGYIAFDSNHDRYHNPSRRNIFLIDAGATGWLQVTPDNNAEDYGYSGPTGSISGRVTCEGAYVSYATVVCEGVIEEFGADGLGYYTIPAAPPGNRFVYAYTWGGFEIIWGYALTEVVAGMNFETDIMNVGYSEPYGKDEYSNPKWSPDGSKVFYKSGLGFTINRCNIPGNWEDEEILAGDWGSSFYGYDIRDSDGKICYAVDDEGIYVANANGSGRTLIFADETTVSVQYPCNPRWSPDGSRIAFIAFVWTGEDGYNSVAIISESGEFENYYSFGSGYYLDLQAWSPDGTYNLITVHTEGYEQSYLYKVNPDDLEDYAELYGPSAIWNADWGVLNYSSIQEEEVSTKKVIPVSIEIFPNPAVHSTNIKFSIPKRTQVEVTLFNLLGQQVRSWNMGALNPGQHEVAWDGLSDSGRKLTPGVYFCRINTTLGKGSARITLTK
ncbi:T9SS type A sorting domain-containing protein [bacterium]|nr:T9SS type A sorting domain-containing protein [bacterium]